MIERYTLEQAAQLSDHAVVKRRFDARNVIWAGALGWLFVAMNSGILLYSFLSRHAKPLDRITSPIILLLTLFFVGCLSELRLAQIRQGKWTPHPPSLFVSRYLTGCILALFVLQFISLVSLTIRGPGWMAWSFLFPFTTIGLRLFISDRVILHVALVTTTVIAALVGPTKHRTDQLAGAFASTSVMNLFVLSFAAVASRRDRKNTVEEWAERRMQAREQLRMRDELQFAREVQLSMLPATPPLVDWADVAGVSFPATEVGGDYYDYYLVDGQLAIICADVAGHGLASGIMLAAVRSGFMLLREHLVRPAHVIERLQEVVCHATRTRMLVTLSALSLDPRTRRALIANAGHPPLVVRRADSTHAETIELFAPPLGTRLLTTVPQREVEFAPGDVFVLHSDGIYETRNPAGEQYGLDRLTAVVATSDGSAAAIRDTIIRDVEQYRASEPQEDDVTVVVVKVL